MPRHTAGRRRREGGEARRALFQMQAEICRVLGHPRRLEILDLLAEGEKSSSELLRVVRVGKANLSQHLALMKRAGLIESRQRGREAFHRLAIRELKDACRMIRGVLSARLERGSQLARTLQASAGTASEGAWAARSPAQ